MAHPADEETAAARLHARRERHRQRPVAVRILGVAAGAVLAAAGLVLLVPLPEAGVPAILGGLGLLALEFDWAAAALLRVERAWQRFKRLPRAVQLVAAALLLAVLVAVVVLTL